MGSIVGHQSTATEYVGLKRKWMVLASCGKSWRNDALAFCLQRRWVVEESFHIVLFVFFSRPRIDSADVISCDLNTGTQRRTRLDLHVLCNVVRRPTMTGGWEAFSLLLARGAEVTTRKWIRRGRGLSWKFEEGWKRKMASKNGMYEAALLEGRCRRGRMKAWRGVSLDTWLCVTRSFLLLYRLL